MSGVDELIAKYGGPMYRRYSSNTKEFLSCARRYKKKGRAFLVRAAWNDNDIELIVWDENNKVTEAKYIKSSNTMELKKLAEHVKEIEYKNVSTEALKVLAEATVNI